MWYQRTFLAIAACLVLAGPAPGAPGLDARPANRTCVAPARAGGGSPVSADWLDSDIGSVAAAGSSSASGTGFVVRGSGADIWGTADEFQFSTGN